MTTPSGSESEMSEPSTRVTLCQVFCGSKPPTIRFSMIEPLAAWATVLMIGVHSLTLASPMRAAA